MHRSTSKVDNSGPVEVDARKEAEGTSGDVDTRHIEQDARLHDAFAANWHGSGVAQCCTVKQSRRLRCYEDCKMG